MKATLILPHLQLQQVEGKPRGWLARGSLVNADDTVPLYRRALQLAGVGGAAAAASRYFGQCGRAPGNDVVCADPVRLVPQRDHLLLEALPATHVAARLPGLFETLNARLADGGRFEAVDGLGYLHNAALPVVAVHAPTDLHGRDPGFSMPAGNGADSYQRLMSEIQMVLHDDNEEATAAINALWLWNSGQTGMEKPRRLPTLYADDPLMVGAWRHAAGRVVQGRYSLAEIVDQAETDVVVIPADGNADSEHEWLAEAAELQGARLGHCSILFANGATAYRHPLHGLRFWRRQLPMGRVCEGKA